MLYGQIYYFIKEAYLKADAIPVNIADILKSE